MADREDDESRYNHLEAEIVGARAMISQLQDELASDVYDRGQHVDYRHYAKGRKAYTPTGRHVTHRPALAFDTAERAARERLRAYRAELRAAQQELAEVNQRLSVGAYRLRRPRWCGRWR